jgi:hypothetical protein
MTITRTDSAGCTTGLFGRSGRLQAVYSLHALGLSGESRPQSPDEFLIAMKRDGGKTL